jgi:hypothetical protein
MTIVKTDAVFLVDFFVTPELPKNYFELLGSLEYFLPDGKNNYGLFATGTTGKIQVRRHGYILIFYHF